jgi:hypothetical protein
MQTQLTFLQASHSTLEVDSEKEISEQFLKIQELKSLLNQSTEKHLKELGD